MTKSIKITRTALTVQISFDKGDISLTFLDEKVLTMFIDLYKDTNAELYMLISDFMNAELITGEAGADYPSCAYLDRNYIEFMPLLEEVDK
jgi:hypothetical protein